MLSNGVVGCCPQGSTCTGNINAAQITTATITTIVAVQSTTPKTVYQVIGPLTTTTMTTGGGGGGGAIVTVLGGNPKTTPNGNWCTTLTMNGAPEPTWAKIACGTALIVSGAEIVRARSDVMVSLVVFYFVLAGIGLFARTRLRL